MRIVLWILVLGVSCTGYASAQNSDDATQFDSDGVPIRYIRVGSGDPVLLIHGFGGRLEFWQGTGVVAALTAAGFTVVAYDSRGHGESGKPYDPAAFGDNEIDDVRRLLDHLAIDRAHVIGYSRGAQIAGRVVGRDPGRVRSVVLGGWAISGPVETMTREDCLKTAELLGQGAFPAPLMRALSPPNTPLPTPEEQAAAARQLASENDVRALAAAFRADCDLPPIALSALRESGIPALAIVGDSDGVAASVHAMGDEFGAHLQVVVIPGANHFTAPAHPEFVTRLVSFLNDVR